MRVKEFLDEWFRSVELIKMRFKDSIVYEVGPNDLPGLSDLRSSISEAISNPIGCRPLHELVRPGMKVVIVADDITRATPRDKIIPILLDELNRAGVPDKDVTVVDCFRYS